MTFLTWHLIAILTVMAASFLIGYSIGKKDEKVNYKFVDKLKNIFKK
jgi:hypothetical protein